MRHAKLKDSFAYVDKITICGRNGRARDENCERFRQVTKTYELTFNDKEGDVATGTAMLLSY